MAAAKDAYAQPGRARASGIAAASNRVICDLGAVRTVQTIRKDGAIEAMDLWTMIVLVVAIGCGTGVAESYFKTQRNKRSQRSSDEAIDKTVAELRQRVEVLEKIITDKKYQLQKELDQL